MLRQSRPQTGLVMAASGNSLPITRQRLVRQQPQQLRQQLQTALQQQQQQQQQPPSEADSNYLRAAPRVPQRLGRRRRSRIPVNLAACRFEAVQIAAERRGFVRCPDVDLASPLLIWSDLPVSVERISELKGHQRVNHFPGMGEISRKDSLGRNMARAARLHPHEFDFVPPTWCLPQESAQFQQYLRDTKKAGKRRVFISKPANGAMGHGIRIYKQGEQVPTSPEASSIVQVYLAKPFLVDGFKCDLRIYVLVTSCDPLRIFFYNDGLLRFSTEKYEDPHNSSSDRLFMHLTNYSINKHSGQYEKGLDDSTGSKRSIRFLNEYLQQRDHDVAQMWRRIIDLLIKTVLVAYPQVLLQYRMCRPGAPPGAGSVCFEVLGFDIMLDHKLKPWLLEVNRSPSFGIDEAIDRKVKLGMLDEALSLLSIRLSDRRRCQAAQKTDAQRRLLKAGGGGSVEGMIQRQREELLAQLQRLRKEAGLEELEARTCHRFRRVFPCDDRLRQERYARLLIDLFASFMDGRAPALLKELEARYDAARPGVDEISDMLAVIGGRRAEAGGNPQVDDAASATSLTSDSADSDVGSSSDTESSERQQQQQQLQELRYRRAAAGRSATARAGATATRRSRPATSLPAVPSPQKLQQQQQQQHLISSGRASSLGRWPGQHPRHHHHRQHPRLNAVLDLSEASGAETSGGSSLADDAVASAARELHHRLSELSIRFPGKSPAEAAEALGRLRQNWKFHRPKVTAYWLARLDVARRKQVIDNVKQHVTTAVQRSGASNGRVAQLLSRLYGRMLASSGQGLLNTFSASGAAAWEAGLTQQQAELACCRRVMRLCQDSLLTAYLHSGLDATGAGASVELLGPAGGANSPRSTQP